jgi:hypothetical protein
MITVEEIKQYLGITDSSQDAAITDVLPGLKLTVQQVTRKQWADDEGTLSDAYKPVVAKLAWWMIQQRNTDIPAGASTSRSLGDISVSYADADLDGRYGIPSWAVKGLPRYGGGY